MNEQNDDGGDTEYMAFQGLLKVKVQTVGHGGPYTTTHALFETYIFEDTKSRALHLRIMKDKAYK